MSAPTSRGSVALVTLGCARNEVDSEELAGRLAAQGWQLVPDAAHADVAVVNTCGFIEQAKKDSIDALLETADLKTTGRTRAVVAVGCLAQRYGRILADELPEADAVLGFDSYADLSTHLGRILDGDRPTSHLPTDRRALLPLTPVNRPAAAASMSIPGHAVTGPDPVLRTRLDGRVWAPLKIASGCDRRCAFCAIPTFRGSFVSRPPADVLAEARWLADSGVQELLLVSENSTSYGKDLGDLGLLEQLLPQLAAVAGIERVRVSYLQPAEMRPALIEAMATIEQVMPWFDVSFQHASPRVLRAMRRFGGTEDFLDLLARIRAGQPDAGVRSNVIVGFPGETDTDVAELERFLVAAELDVVGVFGYSDEDGTEAFTRGEKVPEGEIRDRQARIVDLVEELTAQRAAQRLGQQVSVLVEERDEETLEPVGRAEHQGPEVDGASIVRGAGSVRIGDVVSATVVGNAGVDLVTVATGPA